MMTTVMKTDSVFEIVDSTSDEQYWTLGMFPTLADALAALDGCTPDDMPGDHYDYEGVCRVEVRERKYGWGGTGTCVHAREWTSEYNEAKDEYEWRIRTPNAPDEARRSRSLQPDIGGYECH